jgi:predicted adenylyl cyclase CyaB
MRRNIEIKLRVGEHRSLAARLRALGATHGGTCTQRDIFFAASRGRLKLRLQPGRAAQLIHYERTDAARLRPSDYRRVEVEAAGAMRALLAAACGERGEVRKRRRLFRLDNVRIHLDSVDGLGRFLEIEAVVDAAHPEPACRDAAARLLAALGLDGAPIEPRAYIDLLQPRRR